MKILDIQLEHRRQRKKFVWRLIGLIIIALFLVFDLILTIDYPSSFIFANVDKATERLGIYYSYFTTQSNYIVLVYLFSFLFESKFKKNSKPSFYILLAVTVYITITMFVFWTGIITNSNERKKYGSDVYLWFKTIILHLMMPIIMIVNFYLVCGKDFYFLKEHHKLYLWFILFYPAFYLVIVLVRGTLRYEQGEMKGTCFPYFFLNYKDNGIGVLIAAILGILVLAIGLQYLYLWINNRKYKKNSKINEENDEPNDDEPFPTITYPYSFGN